MPTGKYTHTCSDPTVFKDPPPMPSAPYLPFLTAVTSKGFSPNFARSLLRVRDTKVKSCQRNGAPNAFPDRWGMKTGQGRVVLRVPNTGPDPGSPGHWEGHRSPNQGTQALRLAGPNQWNAILPLRP